MKKIVFLLILVFLFNMSVIAQANRSESFTLLNRQAAKAYQEKDYKTWLDLCKKLYALRPNSPFINYNLACAQAMNGNPEEAYKLLDRCISWGFGLNLDQDTDFTSIRNTREFRDLLKKAELFKRPVSNSEIAFTLEEKDLIPEGMAYDPVEKSFFVSSIYKSKIVKIDRNGKITDFTSEKQDGLRPVTGIKVDAERRILWACSEVSSPNSRNYNPGELGWSGIFKYDLKSGKLLRKYPVFEKDTPHLFNDLVITRAGDAYITDSSTGSIYTISHEKDEIALFLQSEDFLYPNGIALTPDEKGLYLAEGLHGLILIDIATGKYKPLSLPKGIISIGIDGMCFYKNSLVAVQNGLGRISRFYLNQKGDGIVKYEIIESNNPNFIIPTTGAVVNEDFYYLANSQLGSFSPEGRIFPMDKLKKVIVLKAALK